MAKTNLRILSTGTVDNAVVEAAAEKGITLDIVPCIRTEAIDSIEVQQEVEQAAALLATVIFTSGNAVEAVIDLLNGDMPQWTIYCIGERTKEKIEQYFGEGVVAGTEDNAASLAELIIDNAMVDEVIFFCGDHRRDELPAMLEEESIVVTEIEVYHTQLLAPLVKEVYDAVVFFSPTGVESFFRKNKLPPATKVFVIGNTTKKAVQRYCENRISVSSVQDRNTTVQEALDYFI